MSVAGVMARLTLALIARSSFHRAGVMITRTAVALVTLHSAAWDWQNSKWPIGWDVNDVVAMNGGSTASDVAAVATPPPAASISPAILNTRRVPVRIYMLSPCGEHHDRCSF